MCVLKGFSRLVMFSRIDSFLNLSPLEMIVSRNVIPISEISVVNLIMEWKLFACFMNRSIFCELGSHNEKMTYEEHN